MLVNRIVSLTETAMTDSEWHENEIKISEFKANFSSEAFSNEERCISVARLQDKDLLNFYDELSKQDQSLFRGCQNNLNFRMNRFLKMQTSSLADRYKAIAEKILTPCSDRKSVTFGPQEDLFVDVGAAKVMFGDDYPKCAITLTFDDGPHATLTPQLLQLLEEQKLLVNFFVVGDRVNAQPLLLKNSFDRGHLIGSHTQSHKDLRKLSFEDATNEIENGYNSIHNAIHSYLPFFRFPYGASTKDLRAYLNHFSRVEFYWNIDTRDWAIKDPEELFKHALEQIQAVQKGIALFHDIQPQTIAAMPFIIAALNDAGYYPLLVRPQVKK